METGQKMMKKLTKGIEESKKEKERLAGKKEKLLFTFKEIEQRPSQFKKIIKKRNELIDQHRDVLNKAKSDYHDLKKTVDSLRASEVFKELEMKGKRYKKRLEDLQIALTKHMEQYRRKVSLYNERVGDLNVVTQQRDDIKKQYDEWRKKRQFSLLICFRFRVLDEFMAGFNTISLKLKEMYQKITLGGDAELELVDSLDPFSEGVFFNVKPPKKSWKNIANLSGGEKTLSSLALVFALHHYKPTPLYVMDEIDSALGTFLNS
ncbi:hypothetical protein L1049_002416 [Liquidambar formosana]|uniref:RecF/RecN/SMC N-terminal domain-containing protein n=1 Tax=Liquidambar formosana TaxID=63359 RepID=A0AAP0NHA6_LIQFO